MSVSALQTYASGILSHIPRSQLSVMGVVSFALTVILLIQKKCTVYGAIALGLTVFKGLFLLDTAVVIRYLRIIPHTSGCNLTLDLARLFRLSGQRHIESIANIAAFVPFGFLLAEFLASLNQTGTGSWRWVGWVVLAAFGLSLCIECLHLVFACGVLGGDGFGDEWGGGGVWGGISVLVRNVVN